MQQDPAAALVINHVHPTVVSSWLGLHLCSLPLSAALWVQAFFLQASLQGIQALKKGKSLEKGIALKRV